MMTLQSDASFTGSRYVTMSKFLRLALQSMALGLGAWLVLGNHISGGAVFAASFLTGRALQPVEQLLGTWRTVAQARGAYEKLNDLLGAREAETALTQLPAPAGRLDVELLSVLNEPATAPLATRLQMLPGEVVAVVGLSGLVATLLPCRGAVAWTAGSSVSISNMMDGSGWRPISTSAAGRLPVRRYGEGKHCPVSGWGR